MRYWVYHHVFCCLVLPNGCVDIPHTPWRYHIPVHVTWIAFCVRTWLQDSDPWMHVGKMYLLEALGNIGGAHNMAAE